MFVVLPQFLVVKPFERADRLDVGRCGRRGFEEVAQVFAALGQVITQREEQRREVQQQEQPAEKVSCDLLGAQRQRPLRFEVVDRLLGGVDLERSHVEPQRIGGVERVDDVLVGIEHAGTPQIVTSFGEGLHDVAFAQPEPPALPRERVDGQRLHHFELVVVFVEREFGHLHLVALDVDFEREGVADADAVGDDARLDCRGLGGGRRRSEQGGRGRCEECRSFHRCLKSLMSSTT